MTTRLLEFTLQCKILEKSDQPFSLETVHAVSEELSQALLDLRQRGETTASLRPHTSSRSRRNSDSHERVAPATTTTTSRASSMMDLALDTVVCRVMFVYFTNNVHYTKCTMETRQDIPLMEMLRTIAAKARFPAQMCRVFSCDKKWGQVKEVDLHETGALPLICFPTGKHNRLNFIVDCVNTIVEDLRPAPFDLKEVKITSD